MLVYNSTLTNHSARTDDGNEIHVFVCAQVLGLPLLLQRLATGKHLELSFERRLLVCSSLQCSSRHVDIRSKHLQKASVAA